MPTLLSGMSSHSPSSSLQNKTRLSTALEQSPHRQLRNVGRHFYLQIDEDYDCTLCNEAENLDIVLCCVYIFLWLIHFIINIKPSQGTRERRSGKASDWSSSAWWLCVWADMTWQDGSTKRKCWLKKIFSLLLETIKSYQLLPILKHCITIRTKMYTFFTVNNIGR